RILFQCFDVHGKYVPNNTHFDTTRGNIEYNRGIALDLLNENGKNTALRDDFKGNIDIDKLEEIIKKYGAENIPLSMITVTNNSRKTKEVLSKYGIPFYIDCCRFAENAYFIKKREKGYQDKSILEIAQEMFSYADGATMSAKKDGLSNTGGFIATNDDKIAEKARTILIVTEGFPTYGGLARRDLEALAVGFEEVLNENYLEYRIGQIEYLGDKLLEAGVPIIEPTGGHGVYLDAKRFAPHIAPGFYPGQSIANEIYRISGVRTVEIGSVMFGKKDEQGNHIAPEMELVRLAIPRRVYTQNHLDYIAEAVIETYKNRDSLKKMKIVWEAEFLRHFTAKMEYID
ncbi:MAG: tryptophanase, partial [Ignavibacteria bacterium]|nr:tryptophanase [Ignavibacteria bacterium]